jgi:hypothetical protein
MGMRGLCRYDRRSAAAGHSVLITINRRYKVAGASIHHRLSWAD